MQISCIEFNDLLIYVDSRTSLCSISNVW